MAREELSDMVARAVEGGLVAAALAGPGGELRWASRGWLGLYGAGEEAELLGRPLAALLAPAPCRVEGEATWCKDCLALPLAGDPVPVHVRACAVEGGALAVVAFELGKRERELARKEEQLARAGEATRSYVKAMADLAASNRALAEEIARREALEARLVEAEAAARRASEAKSLFVARVSHDIRAPLATVLGYTGLLLEADLPPEAARLAAAVKRASAGLLGVVDDTLDLARIEAGRLELDVVPFGLRGLVDEVVAVAEPAAAAKGLALSTHVDPSCPDALVGAAARLRQVLVNLVSNAVKYTEAGSVDLEVAADGTPGPGDVALRLAVRDTGPGIPEDRLETIFQPYDRGPEETARAAPGTGLGLAIVDQLVRLLGGSVEARSWPGGGSTFVARVPLRLDRPRAEPSASPRPMPEAGVTVLFVDDDPDVLDLAEAHLRKRGLRVATASDASEALAALEGDPAICAAFVDLGLPGVGGLELARRLRDAAPGRRLRLVAATGRCCTEDVEACRRAGFDAFLSKPLDWDRAAAAALEGGAAGAGGHAGRAVLVVDDSELELDYARRVLGRLGVEPTCVAEPEEALAEIAAGRAFDLVLVDRSMPGLDGPELARRARALGLAAPIVVMTASAGPEERARCEAAGCDAIAIKPISPEALADLVAEHLEKGAGHGGSRGEGRRRR